MTVMCIAKAWQDGTENDPVFGEVCTVVGEIDLFGYDCYILSEHPRPGGYVKVGFVPMINDEEIELSENLQLHETN